MLEIMCLSVAQHVPGGSSLAWLDGRAAVDGRAPGHGTRRGFYSRGSGDRVPGGGDHTNTGETKFDRALHSTFTHGIINCRKVTSQPIASLGQVI